MKLSIGRLLPLALAAVIAAGSMTACSSGQEPQASDSGKSDAVKKEVTLNYYTKADPTGVNAEICARFENENPGIKVNRIDLPEGSSKTLQVISTVLQAKDSSMDLYEADVIWPAMLAASGWAEPLDNYVTEEEKNSFFPDSLNANTIDGKLYSLPLRIDTTVLLYRKDLLEKYGFQPPKTWEDVVTISKKIMSSEKGMYGFGASWNQSEQLTCSTLEFIWAYGGKVVDDSGNVVFNSPETKKGIQVMYDMIKKDKITPEGILGFASSDARAPFYSGNMVFLRDWSVGATSAKNPENSKVHDKFAVVELPKGSQDKNFSSLGGWQIAVSAFSKNKEEAAKLAKFLSSYDSQKDTAIKAGYLPSLPKVYEDAQIKEKNPDIIQMLTPALAANARPKSIYYEEVSSVIQIGVQNILNGNISIEESVADMDKQIKEIMSR